MSAILTKPAAAPAAADEDTFVCVLCGSTVAEFGNNPDPLASVDERCCNRCNAEKVVPARCKS